MNTSLLISSGALQSYQQRLDTSANNIANVNTTGFKRKDQSFSEILASQINNQGRTNEEIGRLTPDGIRVGYGTRTGLTQLDMQQGQAMETGKPFDLMIEGQGFFQIAAPANEPGAARETRYTRDGNFHLSPNPVNPGSYHLVHSSGGQLLDQTGNPIELDDQYEVQIQTNGQIQLKDKNGQGMEFTAAQRIAIVDIQNPHVLENMGANLFAVNATALRNNNLADYVNVLEPEDVKVSSGFLEGSNVDLAKEMTDMMTTQRIFQMNSRATSYADQMLGIANNILK